MKIGDRVRLGIGSKGRVGTIDSIINDILINVVFNDSKSAQFPVGYLEEVKINDLERDLPPLDISGETKRQSIMPKGEVSRPDESQKEGGAKLDVNKCPLEQGVFAYFPRALLAVGWVSEYGSRKYAWGGQGRVQDGVVRYGNASARHTLKSHIEGPYDDGDSGLAHLAQEAWCVLAKLDRAIKDKELEIRRGNEIKEIDGVRRPVLGTHRVME